MFALVLQVALAGAGPNVPGEGRLLVYAGIDGERFRRLRVEDSPDRLDIAEGITTTAAILNLTYGITSRAEIELNVPLQHSSVGREDAPLCGLLPGACAPTTSLGVLQVRAKTLVLDEFAGAPLSVAMGGVVRFGAHTSNTRNRFTNAGEGTIDLGARLSLGRSGSLGPAFVNAVGGVEGLYRIPKVRTYPEQIGSRVAPGAELSAWTDVLVGPGRGFSVGPAVQFATRPGGISIAEMLENPNDPDRFTVLRYTQLRVGGKLVISDSAFNSVSLSIANAVFTTNNPSDTFSVGVGVSVSSLVTRRVVR